MSAVVSEVELCDLAVYRTARKAWVCVECSDPIAIGQRHIEYFGEAAAYQSGSRYCLPCGMASWSAGRWSR